MKYMQCVKETAKDPDAWTLFMASAVITFGIATIVHMFIPSVC